MKKQDPFLLGLINAHINLFSLVYGNINQTLTDEQRDKILEKLEEIRKIILE